MLLVLAVGALLQGACGFHHDTARSAVSVEVLAPVTGHDCGAEPHPHSDEHLRQPAVPSASADLAPAATAVVTGAAATAPGPEPEARSARAGADLLTRLCVFRI